MGMKGKQEIMKLGRKRNQKIIHHSFSRSLQTVWCFLVCFFFQHFNVPATAYANDNHRTGIVCMWNINLPPYAPIWQKGLPNASTASKCLFHPSVSVLM